MAINDTSMIAVQGTVFSQQHVHTLHFREVSAEANESNLIDHWRTNCGNAYRALFYSSSPVIQLITARQVCGSVPLRAPVEFAEPAASQNGTRSAGSEGLAPWLAAIVSVRTAVAGRDNRGRFFLGGIAEGDVNGAQLSASYLALVQAYLDTLNTAFIAANATVPWKLVVHSRKRAKVPGTQCQNSSQLVTGFLKRDQLATMKSRKAGSGL